MSGTSRRKSRELAVKLLYSRDRLDNTNALEHFIHPNTTQGKTIDEFANELAETAWNNLVAIDEMIQKNLKNWKQNRISPVLNAILRISIAEILFNQNTDGKVILNEAIELCKSLVGEQATKICNGVLHAVWTANNNESLISL
jgi:transcription antitermination protein NusB